MLFTGLMPIRDAGGANAWPLGRRPAAARGDGRHDDGDGGGKRAGGREAEGEDGEEEADPNNEWRILPYPGAEDDGGATATVPWGEEGEEDEYCGRLDDEADADSDDDDDDSGGGGGGGSGRPLFASDRARGNANRKEEEQMPADPAAAASSCAACATPARACAVTRPARAADGG